MKERTTTGIGDGVIFGLALLLALFGVAMIYSAGELDVPSQVTGIWHKQAIWLAISLAAFTLTLRVSVRWLEWIAPVAYAIAILGLIVVLVVGTGPGSRSWIRFDAVGFQPSEFAKLATVLMLARIVAARQNPPDHLLDLWPFLVVTFVPVSLILLQPDLGKASVFLAILIAALFWSGVNSCPFRRYRSLERPVNLPADPRDASPHS